METINAADITANAILKHQIDEAIKKVGEIKKEAGVVTPQYIEALGVLRQELLNGNSQFPTDAVRAVVNTSYRLIAENDSYRRRLHDAVNEMFCMTLKQGRANFAGR